MATRIEAIGKYRPKIKLRKTVVLKQLVDFIAGRTGLNKGSVQQALGELSDTLEFFAKMGQGVKLDGIGTYLPTMDLDGKISLSHRLDKKIEGQLNAKDAFTGDIENADNIGKTGDELVAMWNEDNPDDPVE